MVAAVEGEVPQRGAGMAVNVVVVLEEGGAERSGVFDGADRPGNAGEYLKVLKFASL